jgi:hypothetical protein
LRIITTVTSPRANRLPFSNPRATIRMTIPRMIDTMAAVVIPASAPESEDCTIELRVNRITTPPMMFKTPLM